MGGSIRAINNTSHKLDEVNNFVGFLLSRHKGEGKKNIHMKGILQEAGIQMTGRSATGISLRPSGIKERKGARSHTFICHLARQSSISQSGTPLKN